jgi:zinc/manganese transport system permease protein
VFVHTIFGLQIIKRGVIFTDLAIGQFAAVGMALSIGVMEGENEFVLTLSFALLGAALITYATQKVEHIEAFIGMLYALGASSIMLILASSAQGTELFSKLSATDILFVTSDEVYPAAILYIVVSLMMFFIYPRLSGIFKELMFFGLLALVVTSSVKLAGVLVVFALLVAPAFVGLLQKRWPPILVAWSIGIIASFVALWISYMFDLPAGYSIIFCQSIVAVTFALLFKSTAQK